MTEISDKAVEALLDEMLNALIAVQADGRTEGSVADLVQSAILRCQGYFVAALPHLGAAGVAVPGWQPMETAPKDGTRFLAYEKGRECRRYECWWQDDFANWTGWQDDWDSEPAPEYWQPLVEPSAPRSALVPSPVPQEAAAEPVAKIAWLIDHTGDPYADTVFGRYAATRNGAAYLDGRLLGGSRSNSTLESATDACQEDYSLRLAQDAAPVPQEATAEPVARLIAYIDAIDALPGAAANFPDDRFVAHGDKVGGFTFGDLRQFRASPPSHDAELLAAREALEPFAACVGDLTGRKNRFFVQLLVCPQGDTSPDDYGPHFQRAKDAVAKIEAAIAPAASQEPAPFDGRSLSAFTPVRAPSQDAPVTWEGEHTSPHAQASGRLTSLREERAAREAIAKAIYAVMPYDGIGEKPAWQEGGNSLKQEEARRYAIAAIEAPAASQEGR